MADDPIYKVAARLVGKPYLPGADGPDAFDCYGLVRFMVRVMHGIVLEDVVREQTGIVAARKAFAEHAGAMGWMGMEAPMHKSVFLAGTRGRAAHCGIVLRDGSGYGALHAIDDMRSYGSAKQYLGKVVFEPIGALYARGMVWVSYWKPPPEAMLCASTNTGTALAS